MKSNLTKLATAGALTLSATASAMAGAVTQPGITLGGAAGEPLPPGFYFVDTSDWGVRDTNIPGLGVAKTAVGITAPLITWSTPWHVLGANLQFTVVAPAAEMGVTTPPPLANFYAASMVNPYVGSTLAWQLGGGFAFSYTLGGYAAVSDALADPSGVIEQRFALTYLHDGWNLTANAIYGKELEQNQVFPDYFNLDLTATKRFGKWEVGAVGFFTTDLNGVLPSQNNLTGAKTSEAALGALVGYDWGPLSTQLYVTRDVYQQNLGPGQFGGMDTRVWGRIFVPLGDPFASSSPSSMFHK
jgi:hypothetical protein